MKKILSVLLLPLAVTSTQSQAAPELIPLYPEAVKKESLAQIPPFPEDERAGPQSNWMTVLHSGEVTVAVYESTPVLIEIKEPFPYDEYVHVLEGEVTLTDLDGNENTFKAGENFLVPKGFLGTWNMTTHYREMVVVETNAMIKAEGL
ncbi:MAG: cupin domain-containing protein [Luminiphilus sp.]|nr:cupin domain-containing protein [Luminiphilus sp.]